MLVTFSTDAFENISYFQDIAQQLLKNMGHSGTVPGAIKAHEIGAALTQLKNAVQLSPTSSNNNSTDDDAEVIISLKQRAIPLINLLEAALQKKCDVLWH